MMCFISKAMPTINTGFKSVTWIGYYWILPTQCLKFMNFQVAEIYGNKVLMKIQKLETVVIKVLP